MTTEPIPHHLRQFTPAQRQVIQTEGVTLHGIDLHERPVVSQKELWGPKVNGWSVTKSGNPAETVLPITPLKESAE